MRFSTRLAATKSPRTLIFEDAPIKMRVGFVKIVMPEFYSSSSSGYGSRQFPLDAREVHEQFLALIRDEGTSWDYDSSNGWTALTEHLKACDWPEFYDFVELQGQLLQKEDDDVPFGNGEYFERYVKKVNALFQEDSIGWTLDGSSHLTRQVQKYTAKRATAAQSVLADKFTAARVHFQKASEYLYRHPVDEGNSIKEMISAVESVARTIAPGTSTLGDAIKALRKDGRFAPMLLESLEKLYAYSNATPQVRHGHPVPGKPTIPDAELTHAVGVAFILYLSGARSEA